MRTGLFGGTFNPVHAGHVRVADEVKRAFDLDRMVIIPSAVPPHKKAVDIAAADRFEMARKAFADKSGYIVSDIEVHRDGPSYTVDTARHFIAKPADYGDVYLVLGVDAFLEIDTWRSYKDLFELLPMVVMSRPGCTGAAAEGMTGAIRDFLKRSISNRYYLSESGRYFAHENLKPVYQADVPPIDISATMVRTSIRSGLSISGYVPQQVEAYIKGKRLYK